MQHQQQQYFKEMVVIVGRRGVNRGLKESQVSKERLDGSIKRNDVDSSRKFNEVKHYYY